MKRVVDLPRFGESKLICDWGEDFDDCEGSFTFWSEFGIGNRLFEVSGL